ncbi:kinesin light chain [Achaetomium macrosporum]|uniref:Kinesin light chain n=1 Tax=Achaetomium macrosporum TaxID=79813 RepID=A0AAN7C1L8_9PEZI|nr:kinesin light chain [Achaetomium macrosporum]
MAHLPSVSFGPRNQGVEVGQNFGSMNTEIHLLPERSETPPPPSATIRFARDPDFVNRGDVLDRVHQLCSEPAGRVALVGLGGVGKSQLAIEYAHRIREGQPDRWVFWVHAGTQARVEEGFRTIADAVKLPGRNQPKADIPQLVYGWLSNERNGRWLMILDSADDRDIFYSPNISDARNEQRFATYLPQSPNGSIVITTRNKDLAFRLTGRYQNIIEVGPMVQADALTLLEKKLGPLRDTDVALDLVQALDLVPLAISQAAAYIQARAPRSSPEKYLAEFRESERKRSKLLEHDAGDLRRDAGASNAILTTWQISFDHIRSKQPSAADLLSLMSFFDRQGIPGWVLNPSDDGSSATDGDADDGTDDDTDDGVDDGFEDDVAMLRNYCLIVADEAQDEFEMHGLVQLSTRTWLRAFGRQETFKQQCIERMAAAFPTGEYENWATCRSLFAHVQVVSGYRPSEETVEAWAKLMHDGGWYAWSQESYDIAEKMLRKAKNTCEERLGKENEATLSCMLMLFIVLSDRGQWEEAEKLHLLLLETAAKVGVDDLYRLTIMGNWASMLLRQSRWDEAEKLIIQVLEESRIKLGVDHLDTLSTMANLGTVYMNQGRLEEAEKLEVQVLEARKIKLGVNHPDTLWSMSNLASTSLKQGRGEEAEKLFVRVMETFRTVLGDDKPYTLRSICNVASVYWHQGRREDAIKVILSAREGGNTDLVSGPYTDALALMEDCAKAQQPVLFADHLDI